MSLNKKHAAIPTALFSLGALAMVGGIALAGNVAKKQVNATATTYTTGTIPTTGWSKSGSTVKLSGITWTYSSSTYLAYNNGNIQIGSKNNPQTSDWTISTPISSFGTEKKITAVSLTAYTSATTATYDISVGGTSAKSGNLTTSSAQYSTNALNVTEGNIVITLKGSSNSKAMYLSGISVTYDDAATSDASISQATLSAQTGETGKELTVTPSYLTNPTYAWSLKSGSAEGVVSLDSSTLNAATLKFDTVGVGSATIQCLVAADGSFSKTLECAVTVSAAVTGVEFYYTDEAVTSIDTYDSFSYKLLPSIRVLPAEASQETTLSIVSGSDVVSLGTGRFNILKAGTAVIRATSSVAPSKYADLTVNVSADSITAIRMAESSTLPDQIIGTKLNIKGVTWEKYFQGSKKWVTFTSTDSVDIPDTLIQADTTSVTVTYHGTSITYDVTGFNVIEAPASYSIKITSNKSDKYTPISQGDTSTLSNYTDIVSNDSAKEDRSSLVDYVYVSHVNLGASPNSTYISIGTNSTTSGQIQFSVADGYYVASLKTTMFNGNDDPGAKLSVNQETFTYNSASVKQTITAHPYANSIVMGTDRRIWVEAIEIEIKTVNAAAEEYAKNFNEANVCGTNDVTAAKSSVWAKQAAYFENADTQVQALLREGTADASGSTELAKCLARYDRAVYVATLRGTGSSINNYMDRSLAVSSGLGFIGSISNSSDNAILGIALVSLLGTVAVSGTFVLLKKKSK